MERNNNRQANQAREVSIETDVNIHAEGSALVKFGNTHVLCTATIEHSVPWNTVLNCCCAKHMSITEFY